MPSRLELVDIKLDETTSLMKNNMQLVIQRQDNLNELLDKSENLNTAADSFKIKSRSLAWKNCWRYIRNLAIGLICLTVIIVPSVLIKN
jgi:hypothetical protein